MVSESDFATEVDADTEIHLSKAKIADIDYYKVTDLGLNINLAFIVSKKIIIKEWKRRRAYKLKLME